MDKRIVIAVLAMCSGLILVGCAKQNTDQLAEQEIAEGNKAEENELDIEETEDTVIASGMQVGIFIEDRSDLKTEIQTLQDLLTEDGMGVELFLAADSDEQLEQLSEYMKENPGYVIVDPIDPAAPASVLDTYSENETQVLSYRELIMDTGEVDYYFTFDVYEMGKMVGDKIAETLELEKAEENRKNYTIEFFMGAPDRYETLFFYNGIQDSLASYMENDVLKCLSGQTSFTEVCTWEDSEALCLNRFADISKEYYSHRKTPDVIICGFEAADDVILAELEEMGLHPGDASWPLIIGYGAPLDETLLGNALATAIVEDEETLSPKCAEVIRTLVKGEKPEGLNYSKVDNHKKVVYTGFGEAHLQAGEPITEETDGIQK